jgi:hypothetical protein
MRCLLNIWGVMLFLRLSWVIGQAGICKSAPNLSQIVQIGACIFDKKSIFISAVNPTKHLIKANSFIE